MWLWQRCQGGPLALQQWCYQERIQRRDCRTARVTVELHERTMQSCALAGQHGWRVRHSLVRLHQGLKRCLTGHSHERELAETLTQEYRRDGAPQPNEHPLCHKVDRVHNDKKVQFFPRQLHQSMIPQVH